MNFVEETLLFPCAGELLPAIVARPQREDRTGPPTQSTTQSTTPSTAASLVACRAGYGVLIVVGGPQYRVGSHRQFLLLSRRLASEGYPAMRFDYRGMGDASGVLPGFEEVSADIGAAIEAFQRACPSVRKIVLWGLCDAASAALLYVQASHDERLAGLVLLNPWVRSESSLAQTHLKHYYGQRLLQGEFWWKLLSGRLQVLKSLRGLIRSALLAQGQGSAGQPATSSFQDRMAAGWQQFPGQVLLILSGQDYTAKEFLEFAAANPAWSSLVEGARVRRIDIAEADHTFSSRALRATTEDATLAWLEALPAHSGKANEVIPAAPAHAAVAQEH